MEVKKEEIKKDKGNDYDFGKIRSTVEQYWDKKRLNKILVQKND